MAKIEELLGDGQARVTAGIDMGVKDFGNGYGVHVSVSFNCNQDEKSVQRAGALAKDIAQEMVTEQMEETAILFEQWEEKK